MPRQLTLFLAGLTLAGAPLQARADSLTQAERPSPSGTETSSPAEDESTPLPAPVRQMLEEALAGGKDDEINTIVKYAIHATPGAETEIRAMVAQHEALAAGERETAIRQANAFALWDGKIELGGFRSTGSSSEFGVSSTLSAARKGLRWTHVLMGSIDYRRANGETSVERILASYGPRYEFDARNFAYGLMQFERDPIVGYDGRYTGSFGIGYTFIASEKVALSATLGPSLRRTAYTDDGTETKFGGRSSLDFKWSLNPALSLQQTASSYIESDTASVTSRTALDARIIAKLSARFSYNMQYESGSKLTDKAFDTTSKVTLIYDF